MALRFIDSWERLNHYTKHHADFVVADDVAYEIEAERFLLAPCHADLLECKRSGGDLVRYNRATEEFGILSSGGVIRTYYKPVPCASRLALDCHGEPDNESYWRKACKQ